MKTRRVGVSAAALLSCAGLAQAQFTESFDNLQGGPLPATFAPPGWTPQNNSFDAANALTNWYPGVSPNGAGGAVFPQIEGTDYLTANYNNTTGTNTISNWMISPVTSLTNNATMLFWTRCPTGGGVFPDRLQVRMNKANTGTNVGTQPTDVGDFTDLLLDINPNYLGSGAGSYPESWTQFAVTVTGVTGTVQGRLAFRYFVENGGPSGANSNYIGIDFAEYTLTPPVTGACCLPSGCQITTSSGCTAQGGTYVGNNVTCANSGCPQPWVEQGDAGDTPATAQVVGGSGSLPGITGTLSGAETDMYQINICNPTSFSASTVGLTGFDTQLWLFGSSGTGVAFDDDDPAGTSLQSVLSNAFVSGAGLYYLAISQYDNDALGATSSGEIWADTPFAVERAPDGPAAAEAVGSWDLNTGTGGAYTIQLGGSCYVGGTFGACCLPNFTCQVMSQSGCQGAGGTYAGNNVTCAAANCPPPPSGACCRDTGCSIMTQSACTTAGGTYAGNNITCAAANCPPATAWQEVGEAGETPGTAQPTTGSGAMNTIRGTLGNGDADMYLIDICNAANFSASTVGLTTVDTQLFIFRTNNLGLTHNDDNPAGGSLQSVIGNSIVGPAGNGNYLLAISQYNKDPLGVTTNGLIWANTPFNVERAPDGPAAGEAFGSWDTGTSGAGGSYAIALTGACFISGGGCYANCDGSTGTPRLTANDFQCFIDKYAANNPYANCDGSTGIPALTANDFQCFINKYAGGCS